MTDARLRALERVWRETGRSEDEQAWLQARLRAGALGPERLALAAWLGHAPALALTGQAPPPGPETWTDVWRSPLRGFATGFARWGSQALLRAGLACCRGVQPVWEAALPEADELQAAIEPLERHLREGAAPDLEAVARLGATVVMEELPYALYLCAQVVEAIERGDPRAWGPEWSAWSRVAGGLEPLQDQNEALDAAGVAVLTSWLLIPPSLRAGGEAPSPAHTLLAVMAHAAQAMGGAALHQELTRALVPWCLE